MWIIQVEFSDGSLGYAGMNQKLFLDRRSGHIWHSKKEALDAARVWKKETPGAKFMVERR